VKPDLAAARTALARVAASLGKSVEATAEDIAAVAVSAMYLEFSKLFARNAVDLTDMVLIAFGGAGPMVGCALARELGLTRILIPAAPGTVCALGGLVAEIRNDFLRTVMRPLEAEALPAFAEAFAALERDARAWLAEVGEPGAVGTIHLSADMRYRGQSYEIEVPLAGLDLAAVAEAFHTRHHAVFDHADPSAPVEVVNLRLAIRAGAAPLATPRLPPAEAPPPAAPIRIFLDGAWQEVALFRRADLRAGHRLAGPAVVAQDDTTLLLPAGAAAEVQPHGHLMVTL
jgi:N-methylhydantoinase A